MTMLTMYAHRRCEKLIRTECIELKTKCLELRTFNGHCFGGCPIRVPKEAVLVSPPRFNAEDSKGPKQCSE